MHVPVFILPAVDIRREGGRAGHGNQQTERDAEQSAVIQVVGQHGRFSRLPIGVVAQPGVDRSDCAAAAQTG